MSKEKRTLPRHVDGRIKVGTMTLKNFFKFLPFAIIGIVFVLTHTTPVTAFVTFSLLAVLSAAFSEFNAKETGFDMLKDIIRYQIEGDLYYERSCNQIGTTERFIYNEYEDGNNEENK